MRFAVSLCTVLILVVLLTACGAHRTHTIEAGGEGSLKGIWTMPRDGDLNVPVNIQIRVHWPPPNEPPDVFTFALRDSFRRVSTFMRAGDLPNEWWFEPTSDLSTSSRYKIVITSGDDVYNAYFYTRPDDTEFFSLEIEQRGDRSDPPLPEHTIYRDKRDAPTN